ncbi:MAG: beta-lactamase family protein [Bacteroidales bacterium]|nr:beta-lactamase family protein [Bacteroidales bacterium]
MKKGIGSSVLGYFRKLFATVMLLVLSAISCTYYQSDSTDTHGSYNPNIDISEALTTEQYDQYTSLFTGNLSERIDSVFTRFRKHHGFRGGLLVGYKGIQVYNNVYGKADYHDKIAINRQMPFQLASVSKQFTAVSIMMLAERGLIDYKSKVNEYIPEFPYPRISIKQLLNHTSGLPNYMWLLEHKWENADRNPTNEDVIELLAKYQTSLYFTPGRKYDYSNTGYAVLASVVERISGKAFPDFVQENIFIPLAMENSFIYTSDPNRDLSDIVRGHYHRYRRFYRIGESVHDGVYGDKGVYSTAADLFKWDQALYDGSLLTENTLEQAFTKVKVRRREYPYGFGFRLKEVDGKKVVYHTGLWEGFRTNLMRYIEDKNTIIVLNNTNYKNNNSLIRKIEQILDMPVDNSFTREVLNVAFEKGVYHSILHFQRKQAQDPNIKIDLRKILEVADYLSSIEKPILSNQALNLYEAFVNTIPSESV